MAGPADEGSAKGGGAASKSSADEALQRTGAVVADSWEDADSDSEAANMGPHGGSLEKKGTPKSSHSSRPSESYPSAPPPTPMSPQFSNIPSFAGSSNAAGVEDQGADRDQAPGKRPEKTTQAASRMIAAGLGVRAPKQTEEQKEYDRAVREREKKLLQQQKEEEKRQEQQKEQAARAMWDD